MAGHFARIIFYMEKLAHDTGNITCIGAGSIYKFVYAPHNEKFYSRKNSVQKRFQKDRFLQGNTHIERNIKKFCFDEI